MKKLKTILTIGVIFAMVFTVFPAFTGDMNAYAATPKKITLNVSGYTSYNTALKWNKCKSPKKGYAVFRDGSCIKRFNKKTTSYTVSSSPGATHSYQIKVWTSKKQYYNTKKKKWVNKKPKASQWKGKQTRYKYTYSKASNTRTVTNPKINQNIYASGNSVSVSANYSFNLNAYSDSGLGLTYSSSNTGVATVNGSGTVTTNTAGTAIITIHQAGNGAYNAASKKVTVNVIGKSQTITSNGSKTLNIGDSYNLNGRASSNLPVTYRSSDTSVAIVDNNGKITAKGYGSTSIYIRQNGDNTWAPYETYVTIRVRAANITIKYNGNGATSGSMTDQVLTNGTGTLKANTFTKTNYIFKGWSNTASATSPKWLDGATFTQLGNDSVTVNLYAVWEKSPEPTVVTTPFTINYNNKNSSGENVISINDGNVSVPITLPEGVKSVTWTKVKVGMADGTNTIELIPGTNGRTLKIKANNALSNKGTLGQVKIKAVFTMDDGYIYYDKDGNGTPNEDADRTAYFTVTNTVYPMVGSISELTYDYKSFNRPVNTDNGYYVRSLYVFDELPDNSKVNININEFNGSNGNIALLLPGTWELTTPSANCNYILTESFNSGRIYLIQSGTFTINSIEKNKNIIFNLSGEGSEMLAYHNHLKARANELKSNNEVTTIKNCIAHILSHYTKAPGGKLFPDGYGDCGAGNTYLSNLLNYCGIKATLRDASNEYGSGSENHNNTAVILSDGTKYIADGTPIAHPYSNMTAALTYIEDQYQSDPYLARCISWDEYSSLRTQTNSFY